MPRVICLLACLLLFVGCGKKSSPPPATSTPSPPADTVSLVQPDNEYSKMAEHLGVRMWIWKFHSTERQPLHVWLRKCKRGKEEPKATDLGSELEDERQRHPSAPPGWDGTIKLAFIDERRSGANKGQNVPHFRYEAGFLVGSESTYCGEDGDLPPRSGPDYTNLAWMSDEQIIPRGRDVALCTWAIRTEGAGLGTYAEGGLLHGGVPTWGSEFDVFWAFGITLGD